MKSHRSAFLSLALGLTVLGMTACEDKTDVVIPPPSNPITVNLVPDDITLEVGQTADFAAVVSGGDDTTVRTATFTTGNAQVATVSATGTVTAVGVGTTTITATATADPNAKDVSTVTVVPAGSTQPAPPTISIKSITQFATNVPVNINNAFGQLDVTLNVDVPPGNDVEAVQVIVEDVTTGAEQVVCSQTFSEGGAALASDAAAAAVEIVCSFNSAEFDPATGTVSFLNGPKILRARLVAPDGDILATVQQQIIFNNQNFLTASVSGSNGSAVSGNGPQSVATTGLLWHGGAITVAMVSVNFDPGTTTDFNVASATVTLTSSGSGVTGLAGCTTTGTLATDPTIGPAQGGAGLGGFIVTGVNAGGFVYGAASTSLPGCAAATTTQTASSITGNVFSVTFPTNATLAAGGVANVEDAFLLAINSVTVGGQPGPTCINPNPVNNPLNLGCPVGPTAANAGLANPVNIDNLAPRVAQLNIVRPSQYFSMQVPSLAATSTGAACTAPCARTVDYGVDRQHEGTNTQAFAGTTTGSLVNVTAGLGVLAETAASSGSVAYLFQLVTADALGNTRTLYATTVSTVVTTSSTSGLILRFGIDQTAPTHTVAGIPDLSTNPATTLTAACAPGGAGCNFWTVSFIDAGNPATGGGPSGFNVNPVLVTLELVTPAGTTCYNPNNAPATPLASCTGQPTADDGSVTLPIPGTDGYWRLTVTVVDAAGNSSTQTIILTLSDHTAPTVGGILPSSSSITGGSSVSFSADLTDNVELGDLLPYVEFNNGSLFLAWPRSVLGATYGADVFTNTSTGNITIADFPRSIENNNGAGLPGGTVWITSDVQYQVRDMAGFELRYNITPWPAAPDDGLCPMGTAPNTSTQNCTTRQQDISGFIVGAPGASQYTALNTANGLNAAHGLWTMLAPSNATICNNAAKSGCVSATPTTTLLTATVTGPAATFLSPFGEVRFYYLNPTNGVWEFIGTSTAPSVTDNTVLNVRTYTYGATWDATNLKVRPAGALPGTAYQVVAIGRNTTGDYLLSTQQVVNVAGN